MKKKVVAVIIIAILTITAFVIVFFNSKTNIPNKELVYQQLHLDGKDEEFVMSQFEECTKDELVQKWGNPDGTLSGFYGDIWTITENESIVVYYSAESIVEHIKLLQNEKNN